MDELKLTEMDLGTSVPFFHEISLPKLDSQVSDNAGRSLSY